MNRRRPTCAVLLTLTVLAGAACGRTDPVAVPDTTPLTVPPTRPHPDGADVALVRVGQDDSMPAIVIAGDGWVYQPTGTSAEFPSSESVRRRQPAMAPAPPEPTPMVRRHLSDAGLQVVLDRAAKLGLFAPAPAYPDPGISDQGYTTLTLVDGNGTYLHSAYALGAQDEHGARARLQTFLDELEDVAGMVGSGDIGPQEPYLPSLFQVFVDGLNYHHSTEPHWPDGVPVEGGCIGLPVDRFAAGVAGTYVYERGDGTSALARVLPDLPGDPCHR